MFRWIYTFTLCLVFGATTVGEGAPTNGTLIFTEHGSCFVSAYTKSSYSHVGIILYERGQPVVFEAKPGGVTKSRYMDYIKASSTPRLFLNKPISLWLMSPRQPYSKSEVRKMLDKANSKLGTPYSVIPTLTGRKQSTLQCAQYVSIILETSPRFWFKSPQYQTPSTLLRIAKRGYRPLRLIDRATNSGASLLQPMQQLIK